MGNETIKEEVEEDYDVTRKKHDLSKVDSLGSYENDIDQKMINQNVSNEDTFGKVGRSSSHVVHVGPRFKLGAGDDSSQQRMLNQINKQINPSESRYDSVVDDQTS